MVSYSYRGGAPPMKTYRRRSDDRPSLSPTMTSSSPTGNGSRRRRGRSRGAETFFCPTTAGSARQQRASGGMVMMMINDVGVLPRRHISPPQTTLYDPESQGFMLHMTLNVHYLPQQQWSLRNRGACGKRWRLTNS